MTYKSTITSVAVSYKDESPIFGENTIKLALDDEAGGAFLVFSDADGNNAIKIDYQQWIELDKAAKMLMMVSNIQSFM
jgi:hypothetical protein